jgi:release factor glutamine methyltransferase
LDYVQPTEVVCAVPGSEDRSLAAILKAGTEFLARRGVESPALACEILASRLLRHPRLELNLHANDILPDRMVDAMRRGVMRVGSGEPVQYVIGQWDFRGLTFTIDRRALIPRPETEQLVGAILDCAPLWQHPKPVVLDVGTGSGCIAISLAIERPACRCIGFDISEEALSLAKENAQTLGVADRLVLVGGELSDLIEPETMDAVVSNPPYIATPDYERLPPHIRNHEPRLALDGGPDGMQVIEPVATDAAMVLKPGGHLFMEIGAEQASRVTDLLSGIGFSDIQITKDLAGKDRFATGRLPA